jgi:ATP-dependent protease HslVU (ClpYQ) peptidase subunit
MVEAVFLGAILFLLWRLKRDIEKYRPLADGSVMNHLLKIMADSQEFADGFVMQMEENKHALNKLARQLAEKERSLAVLVDQAEAAIKKINSGQGDSATVLSEKRYDDVINLVQQGMNQEEASKQSGLTEGEIDLIMELARARSEQPS